MKSLTHANRGRALETTVISSQGAVICVDKMSAAMKWIPGKGPTPMRGPVDYVGEVCGTGRAIVFDAKRTEYKSGFRLFAYLEPHQEAYLNRHGRAGAIAGVLVEATHPDVAAFFWIEWAVVSHTWIRGRLGTASASHIPWDQMTRLGGAKYLIDFTRVPGVRRPEGTAT